jgi:hypothetical protein
MQSKRKFSLITYSGSKETAFAGMEANCTSIFLAVLGIAVGGSHARIKLPDPVSHSRFLIVGP